MRPKTIAIDGPAGSGKSTIGYALAAQLGYAMLDTGLLYRLVAATVRSTSVHPDDEKSVSEAAASTLSRVRIQQDESRQAFISYEEAPLQSLTHLHDQAISELVPRVARHPLVRGQIKTIQQKMIDSGFTVLAGRDIGTVVAPSAELKLYLDVSLEERAARRTWSSQDPGTSQQTVQRDLAARDAMDKDRKTSPMKIPEDALVVRTDKLTVTETVQMILAMCGISSASG